MRVRSREKRRLQIHWLCRRVSMRDTWMLRSPACLLPALLRDCVKTHRIEIHSMPECGVRLWTAAAEGAGAKRPTPATPLSRGLERAGVHPAFESGVDAALCCRSPKTRVRFDVLRFDAVSPAVRAGTTCLTWSRVLTQSPHECGHGLLQNAPGAGAFIGTWKVPLRARQSCEAQSERKVPDKVDRKSLAVASTSRPPPVLSWPARVDSH